MTVRDLLGLAVEALRAHRMRYGLSALAISVGIAAVVLLSSIGEGVRRYIADQMSAFGTTIISINPGKVSTGGIAGVAGSARKLTLDDGRMLCRLPGVSAGIAAAYGTALVEYGPRSRRVFIIGATGQLPKVWSMRVATGTFLPDLDWDRPSPVAVLGSKLKQELFGEENALGAMVRIGAARFRVVGLMESKGQYLTFDMDDVAYIPVMNSMRLFNKSEVTEINLLAASTEEIDAVVERARVLMIDRHGGDEDVTIVSQKDAMKTVDNVMSVITLTVTAIAAISLLVGAIGILTILWIVVRERVQEIGLVKALGATQAQILGWYLCEAALTAVIGGAGGLLLGMGGAAALSRLVPGLTVFTPPGVVGAALLMAVGVGILAGVAPAIKAARLDPVEALRTE